MVIPVVCVGYLVQTSIFNFTAYGSLDLRWAGNLYFSNVYFGFDIYISNDQGNWRSVVEPEIYLGCLCPVHCGARGRWHSILNRAVKSQHVRQSSWPKYIFIFFCSESLLFYCCIMSKLQYITLPNRFHSHEWNHDSPEWKNQNAPGARHRHVWWTRFTGPTWGPPGADRTQVGPMPVPWILLFQTFLPTEED